jgi:hypothetical protein
VEEQEVNNDEKASVASCPARVVWPMWAAGRVASMPNADLRSCAARAPPPPRMSTVSEARSVERRCSALRAARVVQEGRN